MRVPRRWVLTSVGAALSGGLAGCATDDGPAARTATTTDDAPTSTTVRTSDSSDDRVEWVRGTGSSISVRGDLALDEREEVADYDREAGTVKMVIERADDGEVERTRTVDIEAYAKRTVAHSLAAERVSEHLFEDVSITPTGDGLQTPNCWMSSRDDRRIVGVKFVPEDHEESVDTIAAALPESVVVTLDSAAGEFTFEYPVYIEVTEPFVLE